MSVTATRSVLLTTEEVADMLGCSRHTLVSQRCRGYGGPPFVRMSGRHVRYRLSDVEKWLQSKTVVPEPQQ